MFLKESMHENSPPQAKILGSLDVKKYILQRKSSNLHGSVGVPKLPYLTIVVCGEPKTTIVKYEPLLIVKTGGQPAADQNPYS